MMPVESRQPLEKEWDAGKKRQPPNLHAFDGFDAEQFETTGDGASGQVAE